MNKLTPILAFLFIMILPFTASHAEINGVVNFVINEYHSDPASGDDGDANGDGSRDSTEDEFVELYNNSGSEVNISGWTLSDGTSVRHTFPNDTLVPDNCSIVVFGGGSTVGAFGFSVVQTASTGGLSFNNSGDTIVLKSGATTIVTYDYIGSSSDNQSFTRDPEVTGVFIAHSDATGSNGTLFSPGTNANGSFFSGCPVGDLPPTITSTSPSNDDSGIAVDANITVNFSEEVVMLADAFTMSCEGTPIVLAGVPATASSVVLDPTTDLPDGKFCTVTAVAANISDSDEGLEQLDGNGDTNGGDDFSFTFIVGTPVVEIWEIQGNSTASIYDGFNIRTNNNIVTALDTNGFYMQTPNDRDDNDPNTSNGLFVFLNTAPSVSVGDLVNVDGQLVEFFGLTEFSFGNVEFVSSGNTLPTAVLLDDNFPPNDPTVALCSTDQETHKYECLESMHFDMPQGFISAGSSGNAFFPGSNGEDVLVRAGSSRAFREPGIDFPGDVVGLPNSPIFDGNPEILEMDIDSLTLPLTQFAGGTEVAIQGVFGFDFSEYEIWPSSITVLNENTVPGAVRDASSAEATIGSANLFRFFNDVDDPGTQDDGAVLDTQDYQLRLAKLSRYFILDLKQPMIIGLQEVERIDVLNDLAQRITTDGGATYTSFLTEGNDVGGIDVGFMYRADLVTINSITQLGAFEMQSSNGFTLHDRPPLHMDATIQVAGNSIDVHVLVVHMRSRGGIDGSDSARVREKRFEQANSIAAMIDTIQTNNPGKAVIAIGDFNAFDFTDGYADVIGQIAGTATQLENELWSEPLLSTTPLTQAVHTLSSSEQYSFVFNGSAQLLDHALINDKALELTNQIEFARGQSDVNFSFANDATTSLRVSDHDGFVLFLSDDTIYNNGFE